MTDLRNETTTEDVARGIRRRVFENTMHNNGGYLRQACSAAEQLAWLYHEELHLGASSLPMIPEPFAGVPSAGNPGYRTGAGYNGPAEPQFDRLFIAPAHYALVAYATLIETGRMVPEGLELFNLDGSSVEMIGAEHTPGMEVHNGTLGIGLSTAAGLAWGRARRGETRRTWVFMSDGEVQEGQAWEAVQAAAYYRIDTLYAIMDVNDQQCDGAMFEVMEVRAIAARIRAFGGACVEIDGPDVGAMRAAVATPHAGQPLIILARTDPTRGMPPLRERFPCLHDVPFRSPAERACLNAEIAAALDVAPVALEDHRCPRGSAAPTSAPLRPMPSPTPRVLCLSADLTSSCKIDRVRDRHPDRFLSMGMAEQNMLSFAGGLGLTGFRPFVHTFGVFLYRRPHDQLMASIAYPRRRVRLMGFLPGITTPGGMTHQAIEDIAVMRSIPNMTILATGDAAEVESICAAADSIDGPVYARILLGSVPRLFDTAIGVGRMRMLAEGRDVLIVTAGITTEEVMRASAALGRAGLSVRHLHLNTIEPFDAEALLSHVACVRHGVVTLENHVPRAASAASWPRRWRMPAPASGCAGSACATPMRTAGRGPT